MTKSTGGDDECRRMFRWLDEDGEAGGSAVRNFKRGGEAQREGMEADKIQMKACRRREKGSNNLLQFSPHSSFQHINRTEGL